MSGGVRQPLALPGKCPSVRDGGAIVRVGGRPLLTAKGSLLNLTERGFDETLTRLADDAAPANS